MLIFDKSEMFKRKQNCFIFTFSGTTEETNRYIQKQSFCRFCYNDTKISKLHISASNSAIFDGVIMGIFDFMKAAGRKKESNPCKNIFNEPLDRLDEDGDLPFGWFTANKAFIDKLTNEHSYFLNRYIEAQKQAPKEQYGALKSFVLHMENVETLCKSMGECYEFWCNEILLSPGCLQKHKERLQQLEVNFHQLQSEYERRIELLEGLESTIIQRILESPDILQSELVRSFDPLIQGNVRDALYHMEKEKKIERIKSGRSYILRRKIT